MNTNRKLRAALADAARHVSARAIAAQLDALICGLIAGDPTGETARRADAWIAEHAAHSV